MRLNLALHRNVHRQAGRRGSRTQGFTSKGLGHEVYLEQANQCTWPRIGDMELVSDRGVCSCLLLTACMLEGVTLNKPVTPQKKQHRPVSFPFRQGLAKASDAKSENTFGSATAQRRALETGQESVVCFTGRVPLSSECCFLFQITWLHHVMT